MYQVVHVALVTLDERVVVEGAGDTGREKPHVHGEDGRQIVPAIGGDPLEGVDQPVRGDGGDILGIVGEVTDTTPTDW